MRTVHVVGVALFRAGRCLAAQRSANTAFPLAWEFPGGKVEAGESPRQALVREIKEELAIQIEAGDFIGRGEGTLGDTRIVLDVYSGKISGTKYEEPKPLQHAAFAWCTADDLDALTWADADVPIVKTVQALLRSTRTS